MTFAMQFFEGPALQPISPMKELGAYECMWLEPDSTFSTIAGQFAKNPSALPSSFVDPEDCRQRGADVTELLRKAGVNRYGVRIHRAGDYPSKLRQARTPVELLYYQGTWELAETEGIAIVGGRNPTQAGVNLADKMARVLAMMDYTIVSGLHKLIDVTALRSGIEAGGNVIAVSDVPIGCTSDMVSNEVHRIISANYLLVSPVPVLRYSRRISGDDSAFTTQKHEMMSALTVATIIVDAEDDSEVLSQAKAAIFQGRKLFIPDYCFQRRDLTWPSFYEERGAIRIREPEDLWRNLE